MQQLSNILTRLGESAARFDKKNQRQQRQLGEHWFNRTLFKCRSNLAVDYVAETRQLVSQMKTSTNPQAQEFIAEQISQQLLALTTALKGCSLPEQKRDARLVQQSHVAALHQQLATYHGYEQRLLLNIQRCRDDNDSVGAQQQEKRLNRCQQAIIELERNIQKHEEG